MAGLIPKPAGDLWGRVDKVLADGDVVLTRFDRTLTEESGTFTEVGDALTTVDGTVREATDVPGAVKESLQDLEITPELLDQMPEVATKLDEVHRIVRSLGQPRAGAR
ncbi:MAG: hypothetical protein Q8K58_13020 [Acidimicrobiales bacterium]|nr:hypothetical protein [Acidimicrobiales bacterium]